MRRALFAAAIAGVLTMTSGGVAWGDAPWLPEAVVFVVRGASLEELLRVPQVRAVATTGGAALLAHGELVSEELRSAERAIDTLRAAVDEGVRLRVVDLGSVPTGPPLGRAEFLRTAGARVTEAIGETSPPQGAGVQVWIVSPTPSPSDATAGDTLGAVVVGRTWSGLPQAGVDLPSAVTSDSTRRDGVVVAEDLPVTILAWAGLPTGLAGGGAEVRLTEAPAPIELHERYLAQRRMYVPIGTAAGLYVTLVGLLAVGLLALGRARAPRRIVRVTAWLAMSVPALGVGLLAAGHLPTLSYATVVPFVVAVAAAGTLAFAPLTRRDALLPPAAIGAAVLGFFAVEAALGWTAALTPFLGGSELDGGRFYGLPNVFIGLLVGASLYVAHRLEPLSGFLLVVLVAVFAGLPWTGANLGGSVTLFAAAGLWLPLRRSGRLGLRGLAAALGVVIAGTAVVLLAHWVSPQPTHVTGFEESAGGIAGVWGIFTDRLLVGWRLIERNPFALVPVAGLLVVLWVLLRPPARIAGALRTHAAWADALLVTILASVVAYVANDSGAAAAGVGFGMGLGGLLYVSLVEGTRKMGET